MNRPLEPRWEGAGTIRGNRLTVIRMSRNGSYGWCIPPGIWDLYGIYMCS